MQRHASHLFADCGEARHVAGTAELDDAETNEQRQRSVDRAGGRRLEPLERARIAAPRDDVEGRAGEIDSTNIGLAVRAQPIARVPQPQNDARRDAPRAPGALIGRVPRDALGLEAVDSSLGIVARHFVEARIHHRGDLWNRHRRLGDVRRDDDTALRRRAERQLLLVGVERTVQRQHLHVRAGARRDLRDRAPNLRGAGQETQHVSAGCGQRVDRSVGDSPTRHVRDVDRVRPPGHVDHRTVVEKRRDLARVERRRHHDDPEIVARRLRSGRAGAPGLARQRDRHVGVHAPLVELVEHDRPEVGEQRVRLQARRQDPLGDDEEPRLVREAPLEAHLPADLASERPRALGGNARRDGARGHAARLHQDDRAVREERRRNARRLARAWRGGDDDRAGTPKVADDRIDVGIDGKRVNCSRPRAAAAAHRGRSRRGRCDTRRRASCSSADGSPRRARRWTARRSAASPV